MKKVVFVLNNLGFGGVQATVINLANEMHLKKFHVEVIALGEDNSLARQLDPEVRVTYFRSKNLLKSLWMLRKHLQSSPPFVIFSNLFIPNALSLMAWMSMDAPTKIVLGIHNTYSKEIRPFPIATIEYLIVKYLFPLADGIIICSRDAAQDFLSTFGHGFDNLNIIYNPVITSRLADMSIKDVDHPWFQAGQPPVIIGVGRVTKQKDFRTLIEAFVLLNRKIDSKLVILGDGEQKTSLIKLVQKNNMSDKVEIMGFVENPYKYMSASSLFVLSSVYEGLPSVLIEANYLGCRIVSTDCKSGPREILSYGKYGSLVPVGDAREMALSMERQLRSPKTPVDSKWVEMFSAKAVLEKYIDLFLS